MSRTSGVVNAYIREDRPGGTISVVAFPSRNVADIWWRAVQNSWHTTLQRISSQLYLCTATPHVLMSQNPDLFPSSQITLLHVIQADHLSAIPATIEPDHRRDLISGHTYHIRSVANPSLFWHVSEDRHLILMREQGTAFRIFVTSPKTTAGLVMITSDSISIEDASSGSQLRLQGSSTPGYVGVSPSWTPFKVTLATLLNGSSGFVRDGDGRIKKVPEGKTGEVWEIV